MDESLAESVCEFDSEVNMVEFPYQGDLFENWSCRMEEEVPEDSRIHKVERTVEITGKFVIPYITTDKTKAESPVSAHATEIRQEERRKLEAAGEEDPDTQICKDEREVETAGDQDVPVMVFPFFNVSHGSDKMAAQSRSVFQAHH
jgi:hypothetical protein